MEITAYYYNNPVTKKEIKVIYNLVNKKSIKWPRDLSVGNFVAIINYRPKLTTLNVRGKEIFNSDSNIINGDYLADNHIKVHTFEEFISLILTYF